MMKELELQEELLTITGTPLDDAGTRARHCYGAIVSHSWIGINLSYRKGDEEQTMFDAK